VEVTPASPSSESDGAPSSRDLTAPVDVEDIGRETSSGVDRSLIDRLTQSSSRESRSKSGEEETEETEDEPDNRTEG